VCIERPGGALIDIKSYLVLCNVNDKLCLLKGLYMDARQRVDTEGLLG
jgi:hypothetical protein